MVGVGNLSFGISNYVEPVIENLLGNGFKAKIEKVDYEFQKGRNQTLKAISD